MNHTNGRQFHLTDAMILIAATAPALASLRSDRVWGDFSLSEARGSYTNYLYWTRELFYILSIGFGPWSLAFLALRLRRPRPVLRRLARQPGMVACTAATIVLVIKLIDHLSLAGVLFFEFSGRSSFWRIFADPNRYSDDMINVPSGVGCAVAAAWIVQAIAGRWRPERSWIDRAGRIIGAFWIASIPFSWFSCMVDG